MELRADVVGDSRRRRFLDHLLVASLDRALAFAEVDDRAVGVAHDLDLDVTPVLDVRLEEHGAVSERGLRLPRGGADRAIQVCRFANDAHAAPASAGGGLDEQRVVQ